MDSAPDRRPGASDPDPPGSWRPRLRADLADIPAYQAGRRPAASSGPVFSLASNEAPAGPSPAVLEAIAAAGASVNRYPDPASTALVAALADRVGFPADAIVVGTGSVALCQQLVTAAAGPGDEVIFAWRSFEAYPIVVRTAGATAIAVPLDDDGRHDLAAMAAAVNERTRLVFLCSPNNPTGPALRAEEVRQFLAAVPDDLVVVLDEAYAEYVTDPQAADGLALATDHRNLVVLRTLSKAYGLAGLRVGYGVADPAVVAPLRAVSLPFGVSRVAEAAGVAVLAEPEEVDRRVAGTVLERRRVADALARSGWRVPDPQGNFVWLPLGAAAQEFSDACTGAGVTVRCFPQDGVRVTVAEPAANDIFLAVASRWQGRR